MPLTELKVRNSKAAAKPVKMTDGNGMHLFITPTRFQILAFSVSLWQQTKDSCSRCLS